ncbi:MAG TPA: GNAT family N-acetyltransferase [Stellaceae bacterium]|nr:GNAT family N-acetyltransferase [Stellaceae bacterium]
MPLPQGLSLSVEDQPSEEDRETIDAALTEFNRRYLHDPAFGRIGIFLRDQARTVAAGLDARFYAGWLSVKNLWVRADLRRHGIGRMLIEEAERQAKLRGCHSGWLDTFSFRAPEIYRRLGYEVFGVLDYPPDAKRFFLRKQLKEME